MRRSVAAVLAAAGLFAVVPASALAGIDVSVTPTEARYGQAHHASGRMTDAGGAPLADRRIALQERDFPFTGAFRAIDHATTGPDGTFSFDNVQLSRNADLRVVAFDGTTSGIARAWTYPAFILRYKPASANKIVVRQTYHTPRDVKLTARTQFFVGAGSAARSSLRVVAPTRRTAAGRFVSSTTVTLPRSWHGRFRYASCFPYTKNSGMGDPSRGCPKQFTF